MPRLFIKDGVVICGAHFNPEMVRILDVVKETAPLLHDDAVWITSANDSKHMKGSLHYQNKAFDIRTYNIVGPVMSLAKVWVGRIQEELGEDYDVILEKDHIHVEYQPKSVAV